MIYTVLNNFTSFRNDAHSNYTAGLTKTVLRTSSYYWYLLTLSLYKLTSYLIYPFQRRVISMYTVLLQLNRLPFRIFPTSIKKFLIIFANVDLWVLFFKRVTNYTNLYILRERNYPFVHRFWTIFYREDSKYYYELNVRRQVHNEISNFYYLTRIQDEAGNPVRLLRYNTILYYYFNKLATTNYPYFYWTYNHVYSRYKYESNAVDTSQHVRSWLFFMFIHFFKEFLNTEKKESFLKLTLKTFKGVRIALKAIANNNITFINRRATKVDNIVAPTEERVIHKTLTALTNYSNMFNEVKDKYAFNVNTILYNNYIRFSKTLLKFAPTTTAVNAAKLLPITWYTKIHNSVTNPVKNVIILYLRSPKHFNKGRYSRNRQLYRTGVYWCIWLNVVVVYGLHFYFYRVVFSFGYLWFPLGLMILTMFSSRLYKYRYYNINQLLTEFSEFNKFIYFNFLKVRAWYLVSKGTLLARIVAFFKNYAYLLYRFIEGKIIRAIDFFKRVLF